MSDRADRCASSTRGRNRFVARYAAAVRVRASGSVGRARRRGAGTGRAAAAGLRAGRRTHPAGRVAGPKAWKPLSRRAPATARPRRRRSAAPSPLPPRGRSSAGRAGSRRSSSGSSSGPEARAPQYRRCVEALPPGADPRDRADHRHEGSEPIPVAGPPASRTRAISSAASMVELELTTPWRDGMTHVLPGPLGGSCVAVDVSVDPIGRDLRHGRRGDLSVALPVPVQKGDQLLLRIDPHATIVGGRDPRRAYGRHRMPSACSWHIPSLRSDRRSRSLRPGIEGRERVSSRGRSRACAVPLPTSRRVTFRRRQPCPATRQRLLRSRAARARLGLRPDPSRLR